MQENKKAKRINGVLTGEVSWYDSAQLTETDFDKHAVSWKEAQLQHDILG